MTTLLSHMEQMDADTLGDLFELLGLEWPDEGESRDRQLRTLDRYVHRHPKRWLSRFLESDVLLMKELVALGPEKHLEIEYADYPGVAEFYHFLESDNSGEDTQIVWMSDEVFQLVAPVIDEVYRKEDENGHYAIEQLMQGILNLHGVLPMHEFLQRIASSCVALGWTWDLGDLLMRSQLMYLARIPEGEYDTDDDYTGSLAVADFGRLRADRKRYLKRMRYRSFTAEEYLEAGSAAPFVNFGLETPSGKALQKMLLHIGYGADDLPYLFHDLWRLAQTDNGENEIFGIVAEMSDNIPTLDEFNAALHAITDYLDHLPRWALNGYTPAQKGEMKMELKALEHPGMPSLPNLSGPMPHTVTRTPARVLPGSITIPHVGAYDPCPCGSGLQYRHCHGRHLS